MPNPWFKLYGIEMLSDPKYQRLNAGERSCWVTLLCLGSLDDGKVKHCEEQYLISHSGIDPHEMGKYHGILVKFEMLGLITKGRDEVGLEYLQIKNWQKRQEVYSESRERVRKWRESKKNQSILDNVTPVTLPSNSKNRIDKNRIDSIKEEVDKEDISYEKIDVPKGTKSKFIKPTLKEVTDYCIERGNKVNPQQFIDHYESNGWMVGRTKMKDWKAAIRSTWERNKFDNNKVVKAFAIKNRSDGQIGNKRFVNRQDAKDYIRLNSNDWGEELVNNLVVVEL